MPQGKGTYGNKVGRPSKGNTMLTKAERNYKVIQSPITHPDKYIHQKIGGNDNWISKDYAKGLSSEGKQDLVGRVRKSAIGREVD